MASNKNKDLEKHFFEKFKLDYALPEGIVTYGDKPDVIIKGSRKIGIEISHLYIKDGNDLHSEQRQRNLRELVLQNAKARFFASGGSAIELTVSFDENNPITDIKILSKNLAKLLLNLDEFSTGHINKKYFSHILEISSIYIYSKKTTNFQWRTVQSHTSKSMCLSRVVEIINIKNKKLNEYQPCDAHWLLLIVNFWDSAQDQQIHLIDNLLIKPISSAFDKIIIYKPTEELYIEIPTSPLNDFNK